VRSASNFATPSYAAADAAALPKLVVLGAGSIGCYLGTLLIETKLFDVSFIGRESLALEAAAYGFTAQDLNLCCHKVHNPQIFTSLEPLRDADIVLCAVKATALNTLLPQLTDYLKKDALVIALQNGVGLRPWYQQYLLQPVARAIVPFNVVKAGPGLFCRTTGAAMVWDNSNNTLQHRLMAALASQGVAVDVVADIAAAELGKLILNLNNAINALADIPLKQQLMIRPYRLLLAAVMAELLAVCSAKRWQMYQYTKVSAKWLPWLLRLPNWLFSRVAASMLEISPEARSSMWDDFQAGRMTEIDMLNGAVVALAEDVGMKAPMNQRLVQLVKQREAGIQVQLTPELATELLRPPAGGR